jgi:hypothetical protein
MISLDELSTLYHSRRDAMGPVVSRMLEVRDHYNGDVVVPLPELDKAEKAAVANLIAQGIDQKAMRIASTVPDVFCPPIKMGQKGAEKRASLRRQAILGWWSMNDLHLTLRKAARYLVAYACAPLVVYPESERHIPLYKLRDPLMTYPAPGGDLAPANCIFAFTRTYQWLRDNYPTQVGRLNKGVTPDKIRPDDGFTLLEYWDEREFILAVIGRERSEFAPYTGGSLIEMLERKANPTGICPAVVPGRITLDRTMGEFDGLLGMYQLQAKLMALEVIGYQRSIFPEQWLVARPGELPKVVVPANGIRGEIGLVQGGVLETVIVQPNAQAMNMVNLLERNQRVAASIPAEFGGESPSNVRTARRGQAVLSSAVDFGIQEHQEVLAAALEEANARAIAIDKAFFGKMEKSFYFSWNGRKGNADYTPNEIFETDQNVVSYSQAGSDINSLIIGVGQRIGMGLMSKRTGAELDPLIDDPEAEHDRVVSEGLETAFLQSLQSEAASGAIAIADLARIYELVRSDKLELFQAVLKVQREAQERQATSGEPGTPEGAVPPGSPEAQPGLQPAAPAGAGEAIPPGPAGLQNLSNLLSSLRRPAMQLTRGGQQG